MELSAPAIDKFKSAVTNMSLFGNATHSILIIAVIMVIAVIVLIVEKIRGKKVDPVSEDYVLDGEDNKIPFWKRIDFSFAFRIYIPMAVFYALTTYILLFSICELTNWSKVDPSYSLISRYLSPVVLVLVICYPIGLVILT